ncbi:MAG: metal-dependent transcriptional regulator [Clostridia bacterium]|nr:metal-dependent transcriptional regulator [Clostridia bacterium]
MSIHESGEMYLETIYILSLKDPVVRSVDVGEYMGVSKPSVSRAISLLKNDGLVTMNKQGYLGLTQLGEEIAKTIYERHTILTRLFTNIGVDEKTAEEDACRIEHYISEKTFDAIKMHIKQYGKK